MTTRILVLFVFAAVALGAVSQAQRTASAATREGWWLRVDLRGTKAASIQWELGTDPKKLSVKATWSFGGPAEMDLPASVSKANVLQMQAITAPAAAPAAVCVFYRQQGVARIEFNGTDGRQLNQQMKDAKCVP